MNSLIKTSIKRSVTVCVLVIVLLAVGVLATLDMSTNLLPNIKMPMLGISVVYPGASAQSVEDGVTSIVDKALQTVPGINDLQTMSYDNASVAVLTFDYGTDIDEKISVIKEAFQSVTFPQGCYEPSYIKIDMNGTATATISVYNEKGDVDKLAEEANLLATRLGAIEGVGSVQIFGTPERQIRFTALEGLDITALLAVQALTGENLNIPLGTVMQDGTTVSIRNATDATSLLQIMQLPAELALGGSALNSFATLKGAIVAFAGCTMQQFDDYVSKARDAKKAIDEIEDKTADELEEQQQGLASAKSLMELVRNNSSQSLRLMWRTIDTNLVQNDEFVNMTEEDLHALSDQTGLSFDLLKWLQDGAIDGTLKEDWYKLVDFRAIFPLSDENGDGELNGSDITYEDFAYLFQDGNTVEIDGEKVTFEGLDLLHSEQKHASCDSDCRRDTFTYADAVDVCQFADSVNTVAYANIVQTVRDAENSGEQAQITDEQFAALFVNTQQGNEFVPLMSPQVIHLIRQDNFDNGEGSIVDVLTKSKKAHVNSDGNAIYKNGVELTRSDDNELVVTIADKQYYVNNFGRLVDVNGNLVDETGSILKLTDEQLQNNYYSYGEYIVYTDDELIELYNNLRTDTDFGITPTLDTVRFARICNFTENATSLIVPLAYIGHISFFDNYSAYAQYNGVLSVTIEVYAVSDANTTDVVDSIKKVLADAKYDSVVTLLDDKAEFINDSIGNVLSSIIIGGVLAVLVIYLFVRKIGSSLVVSITMPLSVLVALIGLWAMNISLNLVSLGGLAVGIGMLVDNSIVVLESITKRRDQGESVFDSCLHGTREVAGSLLASTLTNVCVFFPILFARGLTREIFYDLVWAVLFSIVMSLIVAVTVIPSLYHLIYRKSDGVGNGGLLSQAGSYEQMEPRAKCVVKNKKSQKTKNTKNKDIAVLREKIHQKLGDVNISKLEKDYGQILSKVLTKRILVCIVALVLFGSSVALVFTTGVEFMPSVDKGVIEIDLDFDASVSLEEATVSSQKMADAVSKHFGNQLEYVALTVGKQGMIATSLSGVIRIQTDVKQLKTDETVLEIRGIIAQSDVQAQSITVREMDGVIAEVTGGMAGQSVTLLGDDMSTLRDAAAKVTKRLSQVDGVVNTVDNTAQLSPQISFTFDRMACAERGVDYKTAVMLLRVGMSGYTAATVNIDGESRDVTVQFVDATKDNLDALTDIVVGFDNDGVVKLCDLLKKTEDGQLYTMEQVPTAINRQNGKYTTSIDLEIYGVDTGTMGKRIKSAVNEVLAEFDGVEYKESGVTSYLNDAFEGLVISLVAAFVLLYSVMACQFESLTKPFIVIMSIPFSFTGGFLALAITGMTLNVVSFVGLIMLMGVIVNGAIVMIDKINLLIEQGMTAQQAVVEGCKSRLRPILMTTLTTVLALVPLALGLGRGGELMQPMGIVVLGGLLLGTAVTLVLIPCFYCIVKRINFKQIAQIESNDETEQEVSVTTEVVEVGEEIN